LTGTQAKCVGPDPDGSSPITVKYGEVQRDVVEYEKRLIAATEKMEAGKDRCNVGKRNKENFGLGRALVQIGSTVHTIEICKSYKLDSVLPRNK